MGMAAHAVIATSDGSVFVHLHPLGTIATASQLVFQLRQPDDTAPGTLGRRITAFEDTAAHGGMPGMAAALTFPYSFPRPRSEEHTSELQSPMYLVCRLLL